MTRADWERAARDLWEEAFRADEYRTLENTRAVLGAEVFCWGNLSLAQIHALRCAVYPTVLESRG